MKRYLNHLCFLLLPLWLLSHSSALSAATYEPPFALPPPFQLSKIRSAIIYTNKGDMYFELYPEEAPWHVANLKYLADKGFYRNLRFHIVQKHYIAQGGAPWGKPDGGPGYSLPPEFNFHKHEFGTLGMARKKNFLNPQRRSNGSQFHILMAENYKMDGEYTTFGKLIKGAEVLTSLEQGDIIKDVKVFVRPE